MSQPHGLWSARASDDRLGLFRPRWISRVNGPCGFALSGELGHYSLGRTSPWLGGVDLKDYVYWNAGISYTWKNLTLDLRYHDTSLNKAECFIDTTDPRGLFTGSGQSKWCGSRFIATLSVDFTATALGVFK